MKRKLDWYERAQHTGVYCTGCGAEMDMCGQTAHHSYCLVLKAFSDAPANIQQSNEPDSTQ